MASEASFRSYLAERVWLADPHAHVMQVENQVETGTPDTYLRSQGFGAWLELKEIEPPKRATTGVRCRHYTRQQFAWAALEWRAGGRCWVFLQLGRAYLLLHPRTAARLRTGAYTVEQLRAAAVGVWDRQLPGDQFLNAIRSDGGLHGAEIER